ncbi:MAG TPA: aldo/keto reductase [Bryobacteraceae bacterium]|nr:aldo/keto reductase [Bryobacteraceae bacterium]
MLYRKAPRTGDQLSILGFGCMRLAQKEDGQIDEERATRQIRYAIDHGVNYIDTAWPYHGGESEPLVGRALAGGYRERVKLATKLPAWLVHSPADMDRFLDAQLQKLTTGRIDYYLVHSLTGETWDRVASLGVMEFLDRAKAGGRIVNAGFSFHGVLEDFKRIVDAYPWEFCQIQYNYLDEEQQAGTAGLKYAASKGLGVIVMEPLRGGSLAAVPQPPAVDALWREAGRHRTPAEWALRWVWNHPEVTLALSGMNDDAQVEENLRIAAVARPGALTTEEVELIGRVGRKYREIMRAGCTGCGYCQPCPSGVEIPVCFDLLNAAHTFGKPQEAAFLYAVRAGGIMSGRPGYASQCSHCLDCLQKCPQGLEIPDLLEQVVQEFEGAGLKEREAMARQFLTH